MAVNERSAYLIVRDIHRGESQDANENTQDNQNGTPFALCDIGKSFAQHYAVAFHRHSLS